MSLESRLRRFCIVLVAGALSGLGGAASALLGACGPFTDVAADAFCPFVLEIFTLGITTGTTATTYDPTGEVTRIQMAAFLSRTVDVSLRHAARRTAINQLWSPKNQFTLGLTTVGLHPVGVQFDGRDLWVANFGNGTVSRVHASDGRVLETWTGAPDAYAVCVAMGGVFLAADGTPGKLYRIDPTRTQPPATVETVAATGDRPDAVVFDGARFWTANPIDRSISLIDPGASIPWTSTTVNVAAGQSSPTGLVFDGSHVWVTDFGLNLILKMDSAGSVLQTVTVGNSPFHPGFDGSNLWVPNYGDESVSVVRASNGSVLQTLTGNGLGGPYAVAFDGERILVINGFGGVSLWKAADLTPLGSFLPGLFPDGVCSDGARFWLALSLQSELARF